MIKLNDLLELNGIQPAEVTLVFSNPQTQELRRAILESYLLPLGLEEVWRKTGDEPEVCKVHEAYMSTQASSAEAGMKKRKYCMFFVPYSGDSILTGFYRIESLNQKDADYFETNTHQKAVSKLSERKGTKIINIAEWLRSENKRTHGVFSLASDTRLSSYHGRLVARKPSIQRYALIAGNHSIVVCSILEKGHSLSPAPSWKDFIVSGPEVRSLSKAWREELGRWSGVYMILDKTTNQRYVGSACGGEGFWGRWTAHVKGEKGVTKHLSKCDTRDYVFSILERVPFNMPVADVLAIERNWMKRLHSKELGLNHGST